MEAAGVVALVARHVEWIGARCRPAVGFDMLQAARNGWVTVLAAQKSTRCDLIGVADHAVHLGATVGRGGAAVFWHACESSLLRRSTRPWPGRGSGIFRHGAQPVYHLQDSLPNAVCGAVYQPTVQQRVI